MIKLCNHFKHMSLIFWGDNRKETLVLVATILGFIAVMDFIDVFGLSENPLIDLNVSTLYSPTTTASGIIPVWKVNFTIRAPPFILDQIKNVTYHLIPASPAMLNGVKGTPSPRDVTILESAANGFLLQSQALGGYPLSATISLKNGSDITRNGRVSLKLPPESLQITPKYKGLTLIIDGEILNKFNFGDIKKINILWGDQNSSISDNFPVIHRYSNASVYIVTLIVQTTRDLNLYRTFVTNNFSTNINERLDAKLTLNYYPPAIEGKNPSGGLWVNGYFTSYFGNIGRERESLSLSLYSISSQQQIWRLLKPVVTQQGGYYQYNFTLPPLESGRYRLTVSGIGAYSELNQSREINVFPSQLTFNQLISITSMMTGVAAGVSAMVGAFVVYYINKRRTKSLGNALTQILDEYKKYKINTPEETKIVNIKLLFEGMRENFLKMLQEGKIDQDQFKMLDEKISNSLKDILRGSDTSATG